MEKWLLYSLLALFIYGLWGFFPKLAVTYIRPLSALIYEIPGAVLVGIIALIMAGFRLDTHPKGIIFSVLTGICGMLGTLFFLAGAKQGRLAIVVSITALYPLITILLAAILLKEPITIKQIVGMTLALIAIVLLSS